MEGKIKWFNSDRGYGFIIIDDLKEDEENEAFFHRSELVGSWTPDVGDSVEFDLVRGERGLSATNVKSVK